MNSTTSVPVIQYNLNTEVGRVTPYLYPVTIIFALLTNIINILVLSRRTLRSSSCTHYFLALAPFSILYMFCSPMSVFLHSRFGTSLSSTPVGCRILSFSIYGSALFVSLMLISAAVDRFFASSSSVRLRNLSQVHVARKIILVVALLSSIYSCPFCIINYWDYTTNQCVQASSTIIVVYLSSRVVLYYLAAPLAMSIFGLLTIYNIRYHSTRVAPIVTSGLRVSPRRRTEGQLARMLIIQVGAYVIFSFPSAITYTITTFVPSMNTSLMTGLRTISLIWQQGTYLSTFFLYILSARVYKQELLKLLRLHQYVSRGTDQGIHHTVGQFPTHAVGNTRV